MRPPIEHTYTLEGEAYRLQEAAYIDEERLIKQHYALSLTLTPPMLETAQGLTPPLTEAVAQTYSRILESIDGADLYARAVTQVCLKEAPAVWWRQTSGTLPANGLPTRVVSFQAIPTALWRAHRKEVDTFLGAIFRAQEAESGNPPAPGAGESVVVAVPEGVSPVLRGRAE